MFSMMTYLVKEDYQKVNLVKEDYQKVNLHKNSLVTTSSALYLFSFKKIN